MRSASRAARGRVFVISSPSGGGKTTVVARVRRLMPQVARSVSVTTRAPRRGEQQGRDYHFVTPAVFQRLRRGGQLLEWARVHTAWYGTPKRPVLETLARGRDIILSIDVQGARQVRRALGRRAVLVFLVPPSMDHLRQRLARRRTETAASMRQRLAAAARELRCAAWYDVKVVNDRLDQTVAQVRDVMRAVRRRVGYRNKRG
jgi:guanylate kinase